MATSTGSIDPNKRQVPPDVSGASDGSAPPARGKAGEVQGNPTGDLFVVRGESPDRLLQRVTEGGDPYLAF
ncbi:MAG: hypothetical protein HYU99_01770 [Deltaproteobacteria bacterium]|nr:hypothetical protein [Deltaproteobacteria bacterium]